MEAQGFTHDRCKLWWVSSFLLHIHLCIICLSSCFWDKVSLCKPGCSGTHYGDHAGPQFRDLPPECWDYRLVPPSSWCFLILQSVLLFCRKYFCFLPWSLRTRRRQQRPLRHQRAQQPAPLPRGWRTRFLRISAEDLLWVYAAVHLATAVNHQKREKLKNFFLFLVTK